MNNFSNSQGSYFIPEFYAQSLFKISERYENIICRRVACRYVPEPLWRRIYHRNLSVIGSGSSLSMRENSCLGTKKVDMVWVNTPALFSRPACDTCHVTDLPCLTAISHSHPPCLAAICNACHARHVRCEVSPGRDCSRFTLHFDRCCQISCQSRPQLQRNSVQSSPISRPGLTRLVLVLPLSYFCFHHRNTWDEPFPPPPYLGILKISVRILKVNPEPTTTMLKINHSHLHDS